MLENNEKNNKKILYFLDLKILWGLKSATLILCILNIKKYFFLLVSAIIQGDYIVKKCHCFYKKFGWAWVARESTPEPRLRKKEGRRRKKTISRPQGT
jgi:hypothetical protein